MKTILCFPLAIYFQYGSLIIILDRYILLLQSFQWKITPTEKAERSINFSDNQNILALIRSFSDEAFENFDNILEAVDPQRRFSDMISFLDLYGLINARVVSMGRYGNTREIAGSLPKRVVRGSVKDFVNHNL